MPFTPFHFGPGLAIKGLIPNQFSFSMFALANVAMDVEPLYRMWRIEMPMHGFSHTLTGAALIALGSVLLGRFAIRRAWRLYERWNADTDEHIEMTWLQAWIGATFGVGSHLLLDAVMHTDIHPFAPLTDANPLLMTEWMLPLHLGCIVAAMVGMMLILARAAFRHEHA